MCQNHRFSSLKPDFWLHKVRDGTGRSQGRIHGAVTSAKEQVSSQVPQIQKHVYSPKAKYVYCWYFLIPEEFLSSRSKAEIRQNPNPGKDTRCLLYPQ